MAVSAVTLVNQFSPDGKYFAQISHDSKLKIWNTLSNSFEQEFTPDFHLTSAPTCLHFIRSDTASKAGSPRKKKRKDSQSESVLSIALGTSSGRLLIYSLTKADLDYIIDSKTSQTISCLSSNNEEYIYSGADNNVFVWNLQKRNISSKWMTGNEKISSVLVFPNNDKLLTASKNIKLWNIQSKEVLKVCTGHSSQISLLHYISPRENASDDFVISGSKGDRLLNCWNLNENVDGKNAVASFLMEDIVNSLSVFLSHDGSTHIAATVRSGVVHVYQHTFNGKTSTKPQKPKTTIQVVSDSQDDVAVSPIQINAAVHRDEQTLCIGYGSAVVQTFENITISSFQKLQCLLREDLHKAKVSKENQISKVRTPIVGNDVHYLTSQTNNISSKRKNDGLQEVPMEKRLENLMVNEIDSDSKVPRSNNVAHLLVQGLHSKDKNILKTALFRKDEQLIKNTIKRLPMGVIVPLFEELTKLIQGKTLSRKLGLVWLKNLILVHSGLLLSNPDLPKIFGEALGSIEAAVALQTPRSKLMGRLELLISQISLVANQENQGADEALLIFNDKVAGDSDDGMEFEVHSNSGSEWEEDSGDDENKEKSDESDNENDSSDEPMSP